MNENPFEIFSTRFQKTLTELKCGLGKLIPDTINRATAIILKCQGKLIVSGVGKSGLIAHKLAATFSSTGTPAVFLHPADALHGDLGIVTEKDVFLAIAKSGESEELIAVMVAINSMNVPIITIVGDEKSRAAKMSNVIIKATVRSESDPWNLAPTASTTLALSIGDALAITVAEIRGFSPRDFARFHPGGQIGRKLLISVEDCLKTERGIPIVHIDDDMKTLLEEETGPNLGGVMIVNGRKHLIGIVTDGDIRRAIMKYGNVLECNISQIMTKNPISVEKSTTIYNALQLMENRPSQISVLPVIDGNQKPIGLLRLHDLVQLEL